MKPGSFEQAADIIKHIGDESVHPNDFRAVVTEFLGAVEKRGLSKNIVHVDFQVKQSFWPWKKNTATARVWGEGDVQQDFPTTYLVEGDTLDIVDEVGDKIILRFRKGDR